MDYLEWLRQNDPITYYEMTSNPTGVNSEGGCLEFVIIILIIAVAIFLCSII